jgi:SAM-dependent methyltransferase
MGSHVDVEALFDDDYLHFYAGMLGDERSDQDAAAAIALGPLHEGMSVLDVPCGHGRLAVRLAQRGLAVTGVDVTERFIEVARVQAEAAGLDVALQVGDMRRLPVDGPYDAVICWFTSFGYFDDDENRAVLCELRRVLRPGGVLLVETLHHDGYVRSFTEAPEAIVVEVDGDLMVDRNRFNPTTGRIECERVTVRGGVRKQTTFAIRLPTIPEWHQWLGDAGFAAVTCSQLDGSDVELDTWRLVVRAEAR